MQAADPPAGELLDPSVLSSIGGMDFVSRVVVDGTMSGIHRSSHKGGCSEFEDCLLYTSPSPRDATLSRMPSSA